jgi:hypothetical protein
LHNPFARLLIRRHVGLWVVEGGGAD